ncbi:YARHG domain-containing protein [Clostridium perfringens]|uniref:YARHG domain-containing protein n=2 Tax=Clostridium perfringens TaxID=1502 RepID=A0AAE8K6D4_CLOPF|nr:YARHG domain-containing protein [Clostridium perfringens]AMN31516.1 hypothetical protein JFP55_00725 [Clostridium perfringens]AXH51225.1 YARHG domain-containing protein [Clostridium perfringens]EDS81776.1 hypothetical protein CPC_0138 [Clostridium perfringens C str. JGS1495]EHK2401409.1 YARHG domain-containing protein [Clostridium perfringens]EJT6493924.1 YARHG domain-containing protein [Clostridium perfringens]
MKFCTKCGNKLSDSMKFCNKCGAKVKSVDKDTETNSDTEDTKDKKDIPNSKNNIDKTIILDAPKIKKEINTNINENIKNNFKPLHDSNFNNKEEYLDASFDDDLDENFNDDESYHNEDIDNFKHSNTKKKILISIFTLVAFVIIGTSIYFLRSPLLYKYYYNSALKSSSVTEKLSYYNSALRYSKNDDLLNSIYTTLKSDSDFVDNSSILTNLNTSEKDNLMSKLYVNKATVDFKNKNYTDCDSDLDLATKYGYNKENFSQYDDLQKKLNESKNSSSNDKVDNIYSFTNENPSKFSGNIYDYPYDFIMPYSNSSYLSASDLSKYNKSTLALMRNEIYARHGYVFNTNPFKAYFNSKSWYHPDSSFKGDDSELNDYEVKNVQTIKSVENSK